MSIISLAADSSTLTLNGTIIKDNPEGDYFTLTPVNELTTRTNGGSNSATIKKRLDSNVYDLLIRVMQYSDTDIFLNTQLNQTEPVIFAGSLKEGYIKDGINSMENWLLEGGAFTIKPTIAKNNQDSTTSAVVEYTIQFRNAKRVI